MRRCLLILAGVLMMAVFTVYMLGALSFSPRALASLWVRATAAGEEDICPINPSETRRKKPSGPALKEKRPIEGWELVWGDEFNGKLLDEKNWTAVDREKNYNGELQCYSADNVSLADGCLYLMAREENRGGKAFTSGMVQTLGKFSFCQGKLEARLKLPAGKGFFPAFWLLANTSMNEVDIMEMIGNEPEIIYGVVHSFGAEFPTKEYGLIQVENPEDFHLYSLEWDERELRWYVDGQQYFSSRLAPAGEMYILLTLAVGGDWPGRPDSNTIFPSSLAVDYIRLYQRRWGKETGHAVLD